MSIKRWEQTTSPCTIYLAWDDHQMIDKWIRAKKKRENRSRVTRSEAVREMVKAASKELKLGLVE